MAMPHTLWEKSDEKEGKQLILMLPFPLSFNLERDPKSEAVPTSKS
jgi:hypothetical protein